MKMVMELCKRIQTLVFGEVIAEGVPEVITIIGANGAGKTTTPRAISRLVPEGNADDLLHDPEVKKAYLGG